MNDYNTLILGSVTIKKFNWNCAYRATVCPRSSDPFLIVTYYIKWVTIILPRHTVMCYMSKLVQFNIIVSSSIVWNWSRHAVVNA